MKISAIEEGSKFNWGNASEDYARFRDVYPPIFYQSIVDRGLCIKGQQVLDIGTGTGVLPRNMYKFGAKWTGVDRDENQIAKARSLAKQNLMNIDFIVSSAENLNFNPEFFDVITICQCYWYLDYEKVLPNIVKIFKESGKMIFLTMMWLPFEDDIAKASEELVLKYTPDWVSAGATRTPINIPEKVFNYFTLTFQKECPIMVHFTKSKWHGRMRASGGVGATLDKTRLAQWENEHLVLLDKIAPEEFDVLHYIAMAELTKK